MESQLRLTPRPEKRLSLTPGLKQSLHLLQLPLVDLNDFLETQIEENPFLEVVSEKSAASSLESPPEYRERITAGNASDEEKEEYTRSLITPADNLTEHLLRQLHMLKLEPPEYELGEYLISNLDADGYLKVNLEEVASLKGAKIEELERILSTIQNFDPPGVAARDVREGLILQLKAKDKQGSLAARIINLHLNNLEKKRYKTIARDLKVSLKEVEQAVGEIVQLQPHPGRSFGRNEAVKITPDALVEIDKSGFRVELNQEELPQIRINPKYQRLLRDKNTADDTREFLKKKFESAAWLINAIEQRRKTLKKIIQAIVTIQRKAIIEGMFWLKPLALKDLSEITGLHVSTVSRAVANKHIHTPYGTFKLRDFFSGKFKKDKGQLLSTKRIKLEIEQFIHNENKRHPLADQQIKMLLAKKGIAGLSRRTITKYRQELKISPSYLRKALG